MTRKISRNRRPGVFWVHGWIPQKTPWETADGIFKKFLEKFLGELLENPWTYFLRISGGKYGETNGQTSVDVFYKNLQNHRTYKNGYLGRNFGGISDKMYWGTAKGSHEELFWTNPWKKILETFIVNLHNNPR